MNPKYRLYFCLILFCSINGSRNIHAQIGENKINPDGYNVFYYENGNVSSEGIMREGRPDGYWKTYYEDNVLKSEGNRKDYELDSLWKFYNNNGELSMVINYKNGKKNGEKIRYGEDGKVISREHFQDDKKHGTATYYFSDGGIHRMINYNDDFRQGKSFEYSKEGNITSVFLYENDFLVSHEKINRRDKQGLKTGVWKIFHDNGFVKTEGKYVKGKREGFFRSYSRDGKLLTTFKYKNGELVEHAEEITEIEIDKEYYPGARVKSEMTLVNGVPNGVYREYSPEGDVTASKIYRNGEVTGEGLVDKQGLKQGYWKEYYAILMNGDSEKRVIKAQGKYLNAQKEGEWTYYYENGEVEQKGLYKNGKPHGIWKWYFEDGDILREEEFYNGLENGYIIEYNDTGGIITRGEFINGLKEGEWEMVTGDHRETGMFAENRKHGIWKSYYQNGKLNFEGEFVDGEPNGRHKYYHENGKTLEEGDFIMGLKDGSWKKYDKDGQVILMTTYNAGIEEKYDGIKVKPKSDEIDQ